MLSWEAVRAIDELRPMEPVGNRLSRLEDMPVVVRSHSERTVYARLRERIISVKKVKMPM